MLAALSPVDYGVVLLYVGALVALGVYFSSRQKSSVEFFLADRSLGWLPLGLSLVATLAAGTTFSDLPGQAYEQGVRCWLIPAAVWLVLLVVVYLLAPLFRGLALDSLFEYLEYRFDARVRLTASLIYVAWRFLWLAALLAAPCQVIAVAADWPVPAWALIVPLGIVATLYTFLGGLRAVTWSGAVQVGLMLLGVAVVIAGLWWKLGDDPTRVTEMAHKLGRLEPLPLEFSWTSGWSLWSLLAHGFFAALAFCVCDQIAGQRFLSAKNVNFARTAFFAATLGQSLLFGGLIYAGLCLLAFYQQHPREMRPEWVVNVDGPTRQTIQSQNGRPLLDPANPAHAVSWETIDQLVAQRRILRPNDKQPFTSADELVDPDHNRLLVEKLAMRKPNEGTLGGEVIVREGAPAEMLPHFVATQLPWGIAGVVLVALLAGWLAAVDSSLCALGATLVFDLHRRFGIARRGGEQTSAAELQFARPLTLVLGAVAMGAALLITAFAHSLPTLLAIATALSAPLLGLFLLGMLTRRTTAAAALTAAVCGLIFSLALLSQTQHVAASWTIVFGPLFTFLLGYLLSFLLGRRHSNQQLRGLVAGCGTLGVRSRDEAAPRITLATEDESRWK